MTAGLFLLVAGIAVGASAAASPAPVPSELLATDLRRDAVTPTQSAMLEAVLARYRREAQGPLLDTDRLQAILADADWPEASEAFLPRLWRWLAARLRERGIDLDWLHGFGAGPQSALVWISRLSMVLMIAIAGFIAINELRRIRYRPRRRRAAPLRSRDRARARVSVATINALPLRDRPRAALELALRELSAEGQALAGSAATHRDIGRRAGRLGVRRGRALTQLAGLAERARFGSWDGMRDGAEDVVALAETVLASRQAGAGVTAT